MSQHTPSALSDMDEFIAQLEQLEKAAKLLPLTTGAASLGAISAAVGTVAGVAGSVAMAPVVVATGIGAGGVIAVTNYLKNRKEILLSTLETFRSLDKLSEEQYISLRQRLQRILVEGPAR